MAELKADQEKGRLKEKPTRSRRWPSGRPTEKKEKLTWRR
jgi:hypothetical protein